MLPPPRIDDHAVMKSALVDSSELGTGDQARQDFFSSIEHCLYTVVGNDHLRHSVAQACILRKTLPQPLPSGAQQLWSLRWHHLAELTNDRARIADVGRDHRDA